MRISGLRNGKRAQSQGERKRICSFVQERHDEKTEGSNLRKECGTAQLLGVHLQRRPLDPIGSVFVVFSSREASLFLLLCLLGSSERLTDVGAAELDLEDALHLAEDCRIGLGLHVLVCVFGVCVQACGMGGGDL